MRRQSWPGSSAPGSGSADLTVALRADPVRACLSEAGRKPPAASRQPAYVSKRWAMMLQIA
jgi:hypothetical protein